MKNVCIDLLKFTELNFWILLVSIFLGLKKLFIWKLYNFKKLMLRLTNSSLQHTVTNKVVVL